MARRFVAPRCDRVHAPAVLAPESATRLQAIEMKDDFSAS
jgi:hypothetical protein